MSDQSGASSGTEWRLEKMESRVEKLEHGQQALKEHEVGQDVRIEVMTSITNRLAVGIGTAGITLLLGLVATFLTLGNGS